MRNIEPPPPESPSPRHLLLILLGAAENGVLGAGEAVKACALFGISENNARVALARLSASGLVETAGRGFYRLGPGGRALGQDVAAWRTAEERLRPWEGDWLAVLTGGLGRADRAALRARDRALAMLGLRELETDLYIRPDNLAGGLDGLQMRLQAVGLLPGPPFLLVRRFSTALQERAGTLWDVPALEEVYAEMELRLRQSLDRLHGLPLAQAARESFLLGNGAIRSLVFDPMLPAPLADVEKRRTYRMLVQHYDQAGHGIWRHFLKAG